MSCDHPWDALSRLGDEDGLLGLVCTDCGEQWNLADGETGDLARVAASALGTVLGAGIDKFDALERRMAALERFVKLAQDAHTCDWCGGLFTAADMVELSGSIACCALHLPEVVGNHIDPADRPAAVTAAIGWLAATPAGTLRTARIAAGLAALKAEHTSGAGAVAPELEAILGGDVRLEPAFAAHFGLPPYSPVADVTGALCARLELAVPRTPAGRAMVLALADALNVTARHQAANLDGGVNAFAELLVDAAPPNGDALQVAVRDLLREENLREEALDDGGHQVLEAAFLRVTEDMVESLAEPDRERPGARVSSWPARPPGPAAQRRAE
ncbi:hypothetical protein D5H75_31795 [Bailinhaonella thermotolerans]|uniref:Uncharacterized protein n=2 Tax=Bailinhaonella thermotolerans TaxID=1070861 RepID=A0A3A4A7M4_9ACTN|nr:hypothetical protein D5H75_31795 [Bailinhaonella thermotolerans]